MSDIKVSVRNIFLLILHHAMTPEANILWKDMVYSEGNGIFSLKHASYMCK